MMRWIESAPLWMVCLGAGYTLILAAVAVGIARLPRSRAVAAPYPRVSVIVACRNEEIDLPKCIASLAALDYPPERLEILLVDDGSTDRTAEIIAGTAARDARFQALSTREGAGSLKAKARGIAVGARHATGDWLFITDADCRVHPKWILHMLDRAGDRVGILGGFVVADASSPLGLAERLSWGYTLPFAFGMSGWGAAVVTVGPNMAVRRDAYVAGGGLERATFRVAEDLAIFALATSAGYGAIAHASPETTVRTSPVPTLTHHFSQQRRWLRGGFEAEWYYGAGLIFTFGYHLVLSLVLVFGWFYSVPGTLVVLGAKLVGDALILGMEGRRVGIPGFVALVPLMLPYSVFTFLWLPLSFLFARDIRWRGADYSVDYGAPRT